MKFETELAAFFSEAKGDYRVTFDVVGGVEIPIETRCFNMLAQCEEKVKQFKI